MTEHSHHVLYKTTCTITGRYYVGMHSTNNLDDGYLGSGKRLGYSRVKHGDENHNLQILEHCSSRNELKLRESEVVNDKMLSDPLCMNLKRGGEGGWDHINNDPKYRDVCRKNGKKTGKINGPLNARAFKEKRQQDPAFNNACKSKHSENMRQWHRQKRIESEATFTCECGSILLKRNLNKHRLLTCPYAA